jgi:hypothetical protein
LSIYLVPFHGLVIKQGLDQEFLQMGWPCRVFEQSLARLEQQKILPVAEDRVSEPVTTYLLRYPF